jgi:hypothetical protein
MKLVDQTGVEQLPDDRNRSTDGDVPAGLGLQLARIFERDAKIGRGMVRAWLQAGGPLLTPDSDTALLFAAPIRQGRDDGDIDKDVDPAGAGRVLFDAYQGELIRWVTAEGAPSDLERRLAATLELVLGGIATHRD